MRSSITATQRTAHPPAAIVIRLSRRPDGAVVFTLRRADGTSTWQKRIGPTAEFFAVHDLTHYAVETTLGCSRGFYGLVAEGWDLADFGHPWPRGPLPAEALPVEVIVGCFDTQRAAGAPLLATQCNASLDSYYSARGEASPMQVTDEQLSAIHSMIGELVWTWSAVGEMELCFRGE